MPKNIEIELKLPILNSDSVTKLLYKRATFLNESFQHDIYFNAPHRDFLKNPDNVNEWLRIRIVGGKAQINYKDWQPHNRKIKTHCKEFEATIDSYDQIKRILNALNFRKLIEVKKNRKSWNFKDAEVSIDSVENLGDFIEVEYKGSLDNVDKAREYLFSILYEIKAETGELDVRGYPYMLLEKNGLL